MSSAEERLPAHVHITCPQCGRVVTTGQSGNSTRCPKSRGGCGATIYVPTGSTRPPVTIMCQHCYATWDTRARAGNMVRCPECRAPRRVPAGIRREPPRAPAPAPVTRRTPEVRPRRTTAPTTGPRPSTARRPAVAPAPLTAGPGLAAMLRGLTGSPAVAGPRPTSVPARPAPAPVRRVVPPRPALPGQVARTEPRSLRDHHRRNSVSQLVTSMGSVLRIVWDAPAGMCEVMDVSQLPEHQRCRGVASRAVRFRSALSGEVDAYACPAHAVALAAETGAHPAITAQVVGLAV